MSYPESLDEIEIGRLEMEIRVRKHLFENRMCTYCHRPHESVPQCKFTDRHEGKSL